ncbi:methyltransferase domain-containing protein [Silicimonas sp. MF1-12-2]|uniref:methyltransferase domain-containing protein n=1 Tax=Silicimonas sp. MF1-12-2 TaxID=3384793 RepID=UPI0039B5CF9F
MSNGEADLNRYVLAHGKTGRERLRVLARIMEEGTSHLFKVAGVTLGMTCLDVGCGGGDVSQLLARRVGTDGRVTGIDFDPVKVEMAAQEAADAGISNLNFRAESVYDLEPDETFDVVYARFVLSHLADPMKALSGMHGMLRPGGLVIVEDVEFSSHFTYPTSRAMDDYVKLYTALAATTGGDANIGPRLPGMLRQAGFADIGMQVHQPAGVTGEVKMISPLTLQGIAGRAVEAGLATQDDVDRIEAELIAAARDRNVSMSTPRVFQTWGRKAA